MVLDLSQHPCFNAEARRRAGRIHLPVAPRCNIQCNYCNRKFDCANESRPGVTSTVLSPKQAVGYLHHAVQQMPELKVVGIAGPGDPFASPEETLETLRLVREQYPEMLLCVASNGLKLEPYVAELARLQVSHVTLTVNAVSPEIGAAIYAWVRDGRTIYRGEAAARLLIERQESVIQALKAEGIAVKINTIVVPGLTEDHVPEVAAKMRTLGADIMNCISLYPVDDTPFAGKGEIAGAEMKRLRGQLAHYLPQMTHCARCRADAVGLVGAPNESEFTRLMLACANGWNGADPESEGPAARGCGGVGWTARPYVAVASMEGILVNQHLGEAPRLWIFEAGDSEPKLVGQRQTPEPGGGDERWRELAKSIGDCRAIVVGGIGRKPRGLLEQAGLKVIEMEGLISEALGSLFRTGDAPVAMRTQFKACGSGCQGSGLGCG
jgi:nitrogen fixation protein NifB